MRKDRLTLLNVLDSFVHDPLVEKVDHRSGNVMRRIEKRLNGQVDDSTLPLSVDGQVQHLIEEAASEENLRQMYVGWYVRIGCKQENFVYLNLSFAGCRFYKFLFTVIQLEKYAGKYSYYGPLQSLF